MAVVTGAASGIGEGLAEELAERGAKVVLVDIDEPNLHRVTNALLAKGVEAVAECVDVTDASGMDALAQRSLSRFGAVHILCNNAGVGVVGRSAWEVDLEDWNYVVQVNLMGVVHGIRAFMPILLEQEEGHVVNTSSVTGLTINIENGGAYATTKHAITGLSESLHFQLLLRKAPVHVTCLCPGPVDTNISKNSRRRYKRLNKPLRRTPVEIALARAFQRWLVEEGLKPRFVAQLTCDAILEERFYVLPHDYNLWIEARMTNILQGRTPALQPWPEGMAQRIQEELRADGLIP